MTLWPFDPPIPLCTDLQPWTQLRQRFLAIGLHRDFTAANNADANRFSELLRQDRLRHLFLNDPQPASLALQLFGFEEPLSRDQCLAALGESLFAFCLQSGLVVPHKDGFLSPFLLQMVNDIYLFVDRPSPNPNTTMAMGPTTQMLARASYPQTPVDSILDVGCGCGVLVLLLASGCRRAVGVDINPRAVALSRINAALNGITNTEFYESDLFSALPGQRFDVIVSQPPFVALLPGEHPITYLHGGARGDELPLQVLAQIPDHLSESGIAFVLSDFRVAPGQPFSKSLPRRPGYHTCVLVNDATITLEQNAAAYLYRGHFLRGAELWVKAEETIAHLRSLGLDHLRQALILIRSNSPQANHGDGLRGFSLPSEKWSILHRAYIDELLVLYPLCDAPPQAILPLTLRIVEGTMCRHDYSLLETKSTYTLQPGKPSLLSNPATNEGVLSLLYAVHGAPTVLHALQAANSEPDEDFLHNAASVLQELLLHGILTIAPTMPNTVSTPQPT
jgi:SAM-dependent methyltransferase